MRYYAALLLIFACGIPTLAYEAPDMQVADRPWLGIAFLIQDSQVGAKRFHVARVAPDTPASRADVKEGDILLRIGDRAADFEDELELLEYVAGLRIGARLELGLVRSGEEIETELVVGRLPESMTKAWSEAFERARAAREAARRQVR